jgi:hypothetical protein|tara:strand:+ start:368 stop:616 length:249 start_codon:yes stop_codon:yes gene_type:complete
VSTTSEPLNTSAIQNFIQQVKSAETSNAREVKLTIQQSKNLAYTLGIVMSRLHGDLEMFVKQNASAPDEEIEVQLDGGTNWK